MPTAYDRKSTYQAVTDNGADDFGFKDGNTTGDDYAYDANGNMTEDKNKHITKIEYNHLNLPTKITKGAESLSYKYDATGQKLEKQLFDLSTWTPTTITTQYAGNYIYENNTLKFFSHPEGYVEPTTSGFDYVYQYKDHLGNIRLSYTENTNTQEEVIFSDGLEEAVDPNWNGWDGSGNSWGHPISAFDSNFKRTGNYSGFLDDADGNSHATSTHSNQWVAIDIDEPTYYTVSAWVYLENVDNNFAGIWLFMKTNEETGYSTALSTASIRTKGQWVKLEKSALVPAHIDKLNVRIDNRYAGDVWFDDVKITKGNTLRTEIVEENNYYPFGLKHKGYNNVINGTHHLYGYNGKEDIDEFGLNDSDFGARSLMKDIARWRNIDPMAEAYVNTSPNVYALNNPIFFIDPDGMRVDVSGILEQDDDGNYIHAELAEAFLTFAGSEAGIEFLSKFAEAGQTIGGHTFDESGEFHSQGIDLAFKAENINYAISEDLDAQGEIGPNGKTRIEGGVGYMESKGSGTIEVVVNTELNTNNQAAKDYKKNSNDPMTKLLYILSVTSTVFS